MPTEEHPDTLERNVLNEKEDKSLVGLQSVIDTITFSCTFYQKQVKKVKIVFLIFIEHFEP